MKEIENKDEVLKRINEVYRKREFRLSCVFCGCDSHNYRIGNEFLELDGHLFVQFFCLQCGYTMLLNYNILMKKIQLNNDD